MTPARTRRVPGLFPLVMLLVMAPATAPGHGGGNWNAFTIDKVNDTARARVLDVQALLSNIIRGRGAGDGWPPSEFRVKRDELITVKEEVDEILEHYVIDGVNVQAMQALHAEPRAGRTAAASRALDAGIALLEHAASLPDPDKVVEDFYSGGLAARLYELLEAHSDRMDVYAALTKSD